jgi:hypothetical protein
MKHSKKVDRAINDKNMKFVKKLLKKNPIIFEGHIRRDNDCTVTITNIRKYKNLWSYRENDKFVYEIDVRVKGDSDVKYWAGYDNRRVNRRVRSYRMENLLREEICYFNIVDICISKITYE